jgi:hypothetical protein
MSHIFTEKIRKSKLIFYRTEAGIRLVVGKDKMFFEQLKASINTYVLNVNNLKGFKNIKCTQSLMNSGIKINICNNNCTVGQAFRLYNEIIEVLKLDVPTYGKLFYEQDKSIEISPSQINGYEKTRN